LRRHRGSCFARNCLVQPFARMVSEARGPHSVGSRDVQIRIRNSATVSSEHNHFCARLYYPSSFSNKGSHKWLPDPEAEYCKALGGVYGLPASISSLLLYPARFIRTRSAKDAPLADGSWPVALFSHGFCGTRTMYSALCTELASHGYFVVAPEHTDGSAALAVTGEKTVAYAPRVQSDQVQQLRQRVLELESCWEALSELERHFEKSLDLSRCVLMGHSFGSASVACVASAEPFRARSTLVLLDPWMGPALSIFKTVQAPTLAIMQGCSMLWPANACDVVQLLSVLNSESQPAFLTEILGARHQDASDVPFFLHFPMALLCASSMTRSGRWVWQRNSELIQQFLNFGCEDETTQFERLAAVSGVHVHKWKNWVCKETKCVSESTYKIDKSAMGA